MKVCWSIFMSFLSPKHCRAHQLATRLVTVALLLIGLSQIAVAGGKLISVTSASDMVYDDTSGILYITSGDKVLRYNRTSSTFLEPFNIGGNLRGIDMSPDGTTLAVADLAYSGESYGGTALFHLINTANGIDTKVSFSRQYGEVGTYSVAYGSDGKLLVTTTFLGSGWVPLRRYDPSSGAITNLLDMIRMDSMLSASADRSVIAWEESNSSDGPFGRYRVSDGNIIQKTGYTDGTSSSNHSVAANRDGTQYAILYFRNATICNSDLVKTGRVFGYSSYSPGSAVYNPVKDIIYFSMVGTSKVYAYDTGSLTKIREYDLGSMFNRDTPYGVSRLKTSRDGELLFAIVYNGISYVRLNNNPPVGDSLSANTAEDTPVVVTLRGNDPDGDEVTYLVTSNPAHGKLSGVAPKLTYTPAANYNGLDSFTYIVNDGDTDSNPVTVTISVTPVNDPPMAISQSIDISEEDTIDIVLKGSDVESDPLTYAIVTQPLHGKLSGTAPNLVYKADVGYYGSDSFKFKVNDGEFDSSLATVTIRIKSVPRFTIGRAKTLFPGDVVFIEDSIVTATELQPGVSFILSPDRSSGIKLLTTTALQLGQHVRLKGKVSRVDGEWQLSNCMISKITDGNIPVPVYMGSRAICNDHQETLNYKGINTTGLLVRTSGVVTAVLPESGVIYISDGFSCSDGIGPSNGLRVNIPAGVALPAKGKKVVINGISRVEKYTLTQWGNVNGDWFPSGTVVYVPSIWIRNSFDLQVL